MNIKYISILFIVFLLSLFALQIQAQEKEKGKLGAFEDQVSNSSTKSGSKNNSDDEDNTDHASGYDYYDNDDEDNVEHISFSFLIDFSKAAFYTFFITSEEIEQGTWYSGYSSFPYSDDKSGLFSSTSNKSFSVYSDINLFHHSKNLNGFYLNSRFSPYPLFSFEFKYSDLKEELKTRYDHLRIYSIFLNYNRLKHQSISFWWGIGLKGILGDHNYNGFALNTGIEIYPASPLSLSSSFDIGFFNATNIQDFNVKMKYHIQHVFFSIGYQSFAAGEVTINGISVGIGFYL